VYDKFYDIYKSCKDQYKKKGITTFSGYITSLIEERMRIEKICTLTPPLIEVISIDKTRVILKDNIVNRIIEIEIIWNNTLYCKFCEKNNCHHIGFAYSIHQIYPIED